MWRQAEITADSGRGARAAAEHKREALMSGRHPGRRMGLWSQGDGVIVHVAWLSWCGAFTGLNGEQRV